MMSALLSQDFRATRKILVTTLGLMLLGSLMLFGINALRIPILGSLSFGIGAFAVVAIMPVALVLLAVYYWRTMYGREGYFTMAIPVRGRTLYFSKVIFGLIVALISGVLALIGAAAAIVSFTVAAGVKVSDGFGALSELVWGAMTEHPAIVWFLVVSLVVSLAYTVVAGSALMTIGAEGRFNRMGIGAPVIGGVILYVVMQILGFVAMMFLPFGVRITSGADAGSFVAQGMWGDFLFAVQHPEATSEPAVIGLGMLPLSVIATVLLAWWATRSLERRTSLR